MLSQSERAVWNVEEARRLRGSGASYGQIRKMLGIGSRQLCRIRGRLRQEKAGYTIRRSQMPGATNRDLPISCSVLPARLRKSLTANGLYHTLGDLADQLADPCFPGLEILPGIGPYRSASVMRLLDQLGVRSTAANLELDVEMIFPGLIIHSTGVGVDGETGTDSSARGGHPIELQRRGRL